MTIAASMMMGVAALAVAGADDAYTERAISQEWVKIDDVAQYGGADWTNVVSMVKGVTAREAQAIASNNPEITYFFYVKGYQMVLAKDDEGTTLWRIFHQGDTVFFKGEPWWGSAHDLADGYMKADLSN